MDCQMREFSVHQPQMVDTLGALAMPTDDAAPWSTLCDALGVDAIPALAQSTPMAWLEWDADRGGTAVAPLVFWCTSTQILGPGFGDIPAAQGDRQAWIGQLCASMMGERDAFAQAALAVEDAARSPLLHVCSLSPRGQDVLRVGLQVQARRVVSLLTEVGWSGPLQEVKHYLIRCFLPDSAVGIQLDLSPGVGAMLGLETADIRSDRRARKRLPGILRAMETLVPGSQAAFSHMVDWPGETDDGLRHAHFKVKWHDNKWLGKAYLATTRTAIARRVDRGQEGKPQTNAPAL